MKNEKRKILGVDVILYLIFVVFGLLLLQNPELEVLKPLEYSSAIFYIFAFFGILAYLINKRPGDYEHLIFSLNCLVVGSFILINSSSGDSSSILGNAVLFFTIFNACNKGYHANKLSKYNDVDAFPKTAICILLVLLGILIISNLYNEITMQTLVLGYYFVAYGVLCLIEPLIMFVLRKPKVNSYFQKIMEEDSKPAKTKSTQIKEEIIKEPAPVQKKKKKKKSKKPIIKEEIKNETKKEQVAKQTKKPSEKPVVKPQKKSNAVVNQNVEEVVKSVVKNAKNKQPKPAKQPKPTKVEKPAKENKTPPKKANKKEKVVGKKMPGRPKKQVAQNNNKTAKKSNVKK